MFIALITWGLCLSSANVVNFSNELIEKTGFNVVIQGGVSKRPKYTEQDSDNQYICLGQWPDMKPNNETNHEKTPICASSVSSQLLSLSLSPERKQGSKDNNTWQMRGTLLTEDDELTTGTRVDEV